ncbi:hypothetical protein V3C99_015702 [Haemonchus contortus]
MVLLLQLLFIFGSLHLHSYGQSDEKCWSAWSPCTVTCISQSREAQEANFARRWRVWLPLRCPHTFPPDQLTQFMACGDRIPQCLELEDIFNPSPRTIYRLMALVLLMLLAVVPSVLICCKYSSGIPVIRWKRSIETSPRSNMMDAVVMTDQLESIRSQYARQIDLQSSQYKTAL